MLGFFLIIYICRSDIHGKIKNAKGSKFKRKVENKYYIVEIVGTEK